jgi:UDP-glucose 4-epimerase
MMKILVTGGAGFIGSNVADGLIAKGHEVVVVDDLSTGFQENINSESTFYRLDIREVDLAEVFEKEKPDVICHHAAQIDVRKSLTDPIFDAQVNVLGSLNLLEQCVKHEIAKVVYASTGGAIYGEPEYLPADEQHPIRPLSQYGVTKHIVEHYLYLYGKNYGLNYTILRYPNVYGPRQDPLGEAGVVAIFTEALLQGKQPVIYGDGSHTRDYVYVGDVVEANLLALDRGEGEIVNLGWGSEISVNQIFDALKKHTAQKVEAIHAPERLGEIHRICLDAAKAKDVLGWEPRVGLDEGIQKTVEFYRKNRSDIC